MSTFGALERTPAEPTTGEAVNRCHGQRTRPRMPTPATASPAMMITGPAIAQNAEPLIALPFITPAPCRVNSSPTRATTAPTITHPGLRILTISLISLGLD
ncbi:MAG: hypothetical protein QOH56_4489 [Pseudonocardiales bacterium]|nr:hypothetical protein [Pseudonocardiales bacterium]